MNIYERNNLLGPSRLEISKIVIYEFRYDHVKPKYGEKAKLCYIDIGNFIIYTETEDIYLDILKQDLILQIIQWEDFYLKEKIKK